MYATFWALLPPIVAIVLALITKEVYSSLFIGIIVGGLFFSGGNIPGMLKHIFSDGMIAQLTDPYNVGILIFLVFLGIMVSLMNKAGGSAAFWTLGIKTCKISYRRTACKYCTGSPYLHRRLFQLSYRRFSYATCY